MTSMSSQIRIDATPDKVWATLADLESVQSYSPSVSAASYTTDTREGVGAGRHCDLQNPSGWVEERITEWQDGRSMTIEIFESNAPMKSFFGRFNLEPDGEATVVTFVLDYELKFGPLGALLDRFYVRGQFGKANRTTLEGLKYFVETGKPVGEAVPATAPSSA